MISKDPSSFVSTVDSTIPALQERIIQVACFPEPPGVTVVKHVRGLQWLVA